MFFQNYFYSLPAQGEKMDILNAIILKMSKEEVRSFKLYASRFQETANRKDILLFDFIRKAGEDYREDKILKKLYPDKVDKNSFYRLKNRLLEDIGKSLLTQHYNTEPTIYTLYSLSLFKLYFNRSAYKIAHYYLKKAETEAKSQENYELLDYIYGEYIKLSHEMTRVNPEVYISLRKENQSRLTVLKQIDDILAIVRYQLKITQNFSGKEETDILESLKSIIENYSSDPLVQESPKLQFKIFDAVSHSLIQHHDFPKLEEYAVKSFNEFNRLRLFNKESHDTKLKILTIIINALFKNGKSAESLNYSEQLYSAMKEYNALLYNKYFFFYNNALVINYSLTDKKRAIKILEDLRQNEIIQTTPFYEVFIFLNLAILHFDLKYPDKAIGYLSRLYLLDSYAKTGLSLKFKINIAELIIRYDLKDPEFLIYRLEQVKREFHETLKQTEHLKENDFLALLKEMAKTPNARVNKNVRKSAEEFLLRYPQSVSSESEIISYNNWIKERFELQN